MPHGADWSPKTLLRNPDELRSSRGFFMAERNYCGFRLGKETRGFVLRFYSAN